MAMDCYELFEELAGLVNTEQGGHVRPHRNFLQWLYQISLSLYEEKFAGWGKSQKLLDDMSLPFLTSANLRVEQSEGSYGKATLPPDYGHFSSARYILSNGESVPLVGLKTYDACGKEVDASKYPGYTDAGLWEAIQSEEKATALAKQMIDPPKIAEVAIDLISNDRWGAVLEHRFNGPKKERPKLSQFGGALRVAPGTTGFIVLDYLAVPKMPTMVYTVQPGNPETGEGDYILYDKTKSTPLEWSPLVRNEFLTRLEKKYGKYIREQFIWETSEADRKQTV